MNIFATYDSPIQSALALDDKRLVKMILETAQMLSTALRRHGVGNGPHYKSAYQKHPCTLWTGRTRGNFGWLVDHGLALCAIYSSIYKRVHGCEGVIQFADRNRHKVPSGSLQPFVDCTEFKIRIDLSVCERYRLFMNLKWTERDSRPPVWTRRKTPDWYKGRT